MGDEVRFREVVNTDPRYFEGDFGGSARAVLNEERQTELSLSQPLG
jgi:hypothetical protein